MENIAEKTFAELKEDISTYVELRLELLKLNTYERVAKTMAVFSYGIILVLLAFFAILFLFLALGFFLGELLGSMALGFVLVVGMYLLLFGITMFFRGKITSKVTNEIITAMMNKDEKDDDDKEEEDDKDDEDDKEEDEKDDDDKEEEDEKDDDDKEEDEKDDEDGDEDDDDGED